MRTNVTNDLIELGVHHRLAAGNRDNGRAKFGKLIQPALHHVQRYGFRDLIVFVAIPAGQITASHRDNVRQHDMVSRSQRARNKSRLAEFPFNKSALSHSNPTPVVRFPQGYDYAAEKARTRAVR